MRDGLRKSWSDLTQEELEEKTDVILAGLRELMIDPKSSVGYEEARTLVPYIPETKYTGEVCMSLNIRGRMKDFCLTHQCACPLVKKEENDG